MPVCGGIQSEHGRGAPCDVRDMSRCTAALVQLVLRLRCQPDVQLPSCPCRSLAGFTCCLTFAQRWASACPLIQHCAECALRQCVEQGVAGLKSAVLVVMVWACEDA